VVVGDPVTVTTIDEVSNIVSHRNGRNITLTWNWPSGATEVVIVYRYDQYSTSPEVIGGVKDRVTRADYDHKQCWELRSAARKKHYFTLFVHDPVANIHSSGTQFLESMGQERTVHYRVVTKKRLFARAPHSAQVLLTSDDPTPLEGLVVVLKAKYPPVSQTDGMVVAEADRVSFIDGTAHIDIPSQHLKSPGYLKLFFTDHASAHEVRLLPAKKDDLKMT